MYEQQRKQQCLSVMTNNGVTKWSVDMTQQSTRRSTSFSD